jgi:conjugal transfer pilus assembly protein TraV
MNCTARIASLALTIALAGCASSMSGIGGTENYACKAPEGALCTSVSGVYANSVHSTQRAAPAPATKASPAPVYGTSSLVPGAATLSAPPGSAVRSAPRVLRVWIAPWEDSDGDLHEEGIVHVVVDTGRWLIEHVRPNSGRRIDGVTAPVAVSPGTPVKPTPETAPAPDRLPLSLGAGLSGTAVAPQAR